MNIPTEQGALSNTLRFILRMAEFTWSTFPSIAYCLWNGMTMRAAFLSSARVQMSSLMLEKGPQL
ncbi:hypothetical protein DY000_02058125 [Brassica cretica]|uniref:Uncharacterized protein n=1 Tax=Brassica cretica TaxID=69181 RepID=A0ABQ7AKW2_BRACR|nr:hypothetical protein DY000_02058125 [Brassica cretica]